MQEGLNVSVVLSGATLVSVLGLALKVFLAKQPQKIEQPIEVKSAACPIPKDQCNERHGALNDQIGNLYGRLSKMEREVSAYEAGHCALKERLDSMDSKLDALLKRGR